MGARVISPWSGGSQTALLAGLGLPGCETLKRRHSESSSVAESLAFHPHLGGAEAATGLYRSASGAQSSAAAALGSPPDSCWAAEPCCTLVKVEQEAAEQYEAPAASSSPRLLRKRAGAAEGSAPTQRKRAQLQQHARPARRACSARGAAQKLPPGEDRARSIQRAYLDRKRVSGLPLLQIPHCSACNPYHQQSPPFPRHCHKVSCVLPWVEAVHASLAAWQQG
jgi:hypothetical protein